MSEAELETLTARAARAERHARVLAEGGVRIVAGSDWQDRPGALHGEIASLVSAGLSPREALLAATRDAADVLRLGEDLGRIRAGYVADLLLLDADPLEDVGNTRRIHMVIQGGRIVGGRSRD